MTKIKNIILGGIFWTVTNQLSATLIGLVVMGFLSRLLKPSEYGILGMVTLVTGFLNVIKDFGFGAALVQKKEVTDDEYSTVFWMNVAIGLLFTILVFSIAPYIALFFKEPLVESVARALSFTFFLNSIGIVWSNQLIKKVAFKEIFYRNFISIVLSGMVGILLAYQGWGVWVLVTQSYVLLVSNTILNYLQVRWIPTWTFKFEYVRNFLKFGGPLWADQSFNYWVRNVDNLLVGRILGKDSLAFYGKAYSLMLLPVKRLSGTITKVLFPSFSLIQDDTKKIASIYLKISRFVAFVAFPVMIGFSVLSESVILIVYGDQWRQVIPIFRVLSLLGMFQAIATITGNIFISRGKTKLLFQLGLFTRSVMITGIVIGLFGWGLMGMVYGYCLASSIAFLPELYFMGKLINLKLKIILLNFLPYLMIAVFSVLLFIVFMPKLRLGLFIEFAINFGAILVTYLLLNLIFKTDAFIDLRELIKGFRKKH